MRKGHLQKTLTVTEEFGTYFEILLANVGRTGKEQKNERIRNCLVIFGHNLTLLISSVIYRVFQKGGPNFRAMSFQIGSIFLEHPVLHFAWCFPHGLFQLLLKVLWSPSMEVTSGFWRWHKAWLRWLSQINMRSQTDVCIFQGEKLLQISPIVFLGDLHLLSLEVVCSSHTHKS